MSVLAILAATWALARAQPYNAGGLLTEVMTVAFAVLLTTLLTRGVRPPDWLLEDAPRQLRSVGVYLVFVFGVMTGGPFVDLPTPPWTSTALYFLCTTVVPLVLLAGGAWRWPWPLTRPGRLRLLAVAAVAFGAVWIRGPLGEEYSSPSRVGNTVALLETLAAAASEELVWRVMLLSYLCAVLKSPLGAPAITSVLFGLWHAPGEIAQAQVPPHLWLQHEAVTTIPLAAAMDGLLFGALWLRTRSFLIVAVCHALANVFAGEMIVADRPALDPFSRVPGAAAPASST